MIAAISLLCFVAASLAIPVPRDYYPKSGCEQYGCAHGHGVHGINGGVIGINSNGFESTMLGFDGGNSAAAAASAAASGLNSAAAAVAASGQQGLFGFNNGFDAEFGFNGGNSAATAASAAASGMNAASVAAAAAGSSGGSSGHGPFVGYQGTTGQQLIGSYNGLIAPQGPIVQYQGVQQFGGFDGLAAAAAAASAGQQSAAAAAAAAAGRNAAASAAAAAGRNAAAAAAAAVGRNAAAAAAAAAGRNDAAAAAAAAAAASGSNTGSQFGIGGLTGSQFTGQIGGPYVQPSGYYPGVPVFGQNSGAAAAASAAASNNAAAAAAAAAAASRSNGFIDSGIIGGSSGIIGSQIVSGRKVY